MHKTGLKFATECPSVTMFMIVTIGGSATKDRLEFDGEVSNGYSIYYCDRRRLRRHRQAWFWREMAHCIAYNKYDTCSEAIFRQQYNY